MIQLALGFPGERFIYLPLSLIDVMIDSPLTGDLILYSLGHFHMHSTTTSTVSMDVNNIFLSIVKREKAGLK